MRKKSVSEKSEIANNEDLDSGSELTATLLQMLIPIALKGVEKMLLDEVERLAGPRNGQNKGDLQRWGYNDGSVYLGEQKVPIKVPRVRNKKSNKSVQLESYQQLQDDSLANESLVEKLLYGISQRNVGKVVSQLPGLYGVSKSEVSRKFIEESSRKMEEFFTRDLSNEDIVAILMDGKRFGPMQVIVAMGIAMDGSKKILGFVEAGSENHIVIKDFLIDLQSRGLKLETEILYVIDGSKGMRKGIIEAIGDWAFIQRCQWHKRENIVSYLPKKEQKRMRIRLQGAYQRKTLLSAQGELAKIAKEIKLMSKSGHNSMLEGLEETLTLQRLGVFQELGRSLKTTNQLESINRRLKDFTGRVNRWKSSDQRNRWVASSLIEIESGLNRLSGFTYLIDLKKQMKILRSKRASKLAA